MPRLVFALLALAPLAPPVARAESCTLARMAELPVTMLGMQPLVHAAINGQDALGAARARDHAHRRP